MLGGLSLAASLFVSRGLAAGFFRLGLATSFLGRHLRLQRAPLRIEIRALLHSLIDIIGLLRALLVVGRWRHHDLVDRAVGRLRRPRSTLAGGIRAG
ncbi:hypothetical protein ACVOMV_27520 (plasmid) [Mesorhizobium atlanticum]|uniref:hypothetical protein n=1 Tax=Mesorhizobium atlanticum TaxID=2233532 RepID=UPI00370378B0